MHRCGGRSSARSVSVADTPAGRERPDAADAADAASVTVHKPSHSRITLQKDETCFRDDVLLIINFDIFSCHSVAFFK